MFILLLCLCLILGGSAQVYSPGFNSYGYPGSYGNMFGGSGGYMGGYSPYGSPFGMSGLSGYPGSSYYGQNMLYGGMNGLGGYGSPYNRLGSAATNHLPLPVAQPQNQPVRSQSFVFLGNSGTAPDPNCFH